ncbi:MAG TPA: OmpA family protein, partial [Hyphomicrobium sp.]|nr:OmpA family protein [Hyphomicrobium sp.]
RDNTQVITETDRNGQLLRRYRRDRDGRETIIIDNRRRKDNFGRNLAIGVGVGAGIIAGAAILNSVVDVPPPRVRVPRDKYIVDYERASEEDVYEALNAPPVDDFDGRGYTLDQIRATPYLRERMRRVDLDDITFETGSWEIDPSQYRKLERIARAMKRVIDRNPNEVFMIEGYTDAVGSDVDNLTLSDRRAESVAVVLSEEFEVPFGNLTTQGYGEEYLKIPTDGPERQNRRVAARRITPLLEHDNISAAPPPPPPPPPTYREERRWRRYN